MRANINIFKKSVFLFRLDIKTHRPESVVTRNHCAVRIFHPTAKKVSSTVCELHNKFFHTIPCALAQSIRFFSVSAHKNIAYIHIAGILDRIFELCNQILVFRLFHRSDNNVFHTSPDTKYNYHTARCQFQF